MRKKLTVLALAIATPFAALLLARALFAFAAVLGFEMNDADRSEVAAIFVFLSSFVIFIPVVIALCEWGAEPEAPR